MPATTSIQALHLGKACLLSNCSTGMVAEQVILELTTDGDRVKLGPSDPDLPTRPFWADAAAYSVLHICTPAVKPPESPVSAYERRLLWRQVYVASLHDGFSPAAAIKAAESGLLDFDKAFKA